jgi:arylamine N-acetyltransferase
MTIGWADRYLAFLDMQRGEPGRRELARIGAAQHRLVPFENVTSLLRRRTSPDGPVPAVDTDALLAAWEQGRSGGVCFEVTAMVERLLGELGYHAHPVLGQITFPASHQAIMVELDEGPYLLDLGCGAPLSEPVPLDRVSEVHPSGLSYRFRPDFKAMTCVQDRLIEGEWRAFCHYDLLPADERVREGGYQRHHIPTESWVAGAIVLVRFINDEVFSVRDGVFTHYRAGGKQSRSMRGVDDYEEVVRGALQLPALPIADGIEALRALTGAEI